MSKLTGSAEKKIELQARGVRIPSELHDELKARFNFPGLDVGWLVFSFEDPQRDGRLIHFFSSGAQFSANSPYVLAKAASGFQIQVRGEPYLDLVMNKRPAFYDSKTSDGSPMILFGSIAAPTHLNIVKTMECAWVKAGKPCKFCAYRFAWNQEDDKSPAAIAHMVEAAVKEGLVEHISIHTGTVSVVDKGIGGVIDAAQAIHERLGKHIPIETGFEPVEDSILLEKAKRAGVDVVCVNVECFGDEVRRHVMPVKGTIPLSKYKDTWKECVKVFGKNQVYSVILVGVGDDDTAILEGAEMIAEHGVIPWVEPFYPIPGAEWEDRTPPSAERMSKLYEQVVPILRKHDLDFNEAAAGCIRDGLYGALREVWQADDGEARSDLPQD